LKTCVRRIWKSWIVDACCRRVCKLTTLDRQSKQWQPIRTLYEAGSKKTGASLLTDSHHIDSHNSWPYSPRNTESSRGPLLDGLSMKTTLVQQAVLAGTIATAVGVFAQEPTLPVGNWRSPGHATFTNPGLTGATLYLNIDVAKDGSFRGTWGQYLCNSYPGAYGIFIYSCSRIGSNRVSGRFGPGSQGTIELDTLGRSTFTWKAPSADELEIDLPKNWQGDDTILYRARVTRDGKPKPEVPAAPREEGPPPSANALYREFKQNADAALARHGGKTLELEGRRGTVIELSDGGAAIHIADGFTSPALVLYFSHVKDVEGIGEGALFRFRCTVASFDYQYVHLEACSIVR